MASRARIAADAREPTRAAPPTRRYDPATTRARILEAAYLLFGTRGYSATGTADIAREADVSEGSIFYHFGSKSALLSELGTLHGHKLTQAMEQDDPLDTLTFEVTINRCFDFCEVNQLWEAVADDPECRAPGRQPSPEAEPFYTAAREAVVQWTRRHLDAVARAHGAFPFDTALAANMIYALVGECMKQYFSPDRTDSERARIRAECIRFCTAAAGHPAIDRPPAA